MSFLFLKGSRRESRSRSRERRDEKKESRSKKPSKGSDNEKREPWLHPLLRVRCVDSSFKDGQFYKQKVFLLAVVLFQMINFFHECKNTLSVWIADGRGGRDFQESLHL